MSDHNVNLFPLLFGKGSNLPMLNIPHFSGDEKINK